MNYREFFSQVCDLTRGLGVVVRTESFVAPDFPKETAVFISSDAHEVPVAFADISPLMTIADATIQSRVDMACDTLADLISGVGRLNHQQRSAYNRLSKVALKPKSRLIHAH